MEEEIFKNIEDFPSYQVSNFGRVKSFKEYHGTSKRILKCQLDTHGYNYIILYKNKQQHIKKIHRLVFETFIRKLDENEDVHHLDTDRNNNKISNLEAKLEGEHSRLHNKGKTYSEETRAKLSGENNGFHKLTLKQIIQIKMLFKLGFKNNYIHTHYSQIKYHTLFDIRNERVWKYVRV